MDYKCVQQHRSLAFLADYHCSLISACQPPSSPPHLPPVCLDNDPAVSLLCPCWLPSKRERERGGENCDFISIWCKCWGDSSIFLLPHHCMFNHCILISGTNGLTSWLLGGQYDLRPSVRGDGARVCVGAYVLSFIWLAACFSVCTKDCVDLCVSLCRQGVA